MTYDFVTNVRPLIKVIDGKTYNTETAKMVSACLDNCFSYAVIQLYKKKTGEYFILQFEQTGKIPDEIYPQSHECFESNLSSLNVSKEIAKDFPE